LTFSSSGESADVGRILRSMGNNTSFVKVGALLAGLVTLGAVSSAGAGEPLHVTGQGQAPHDRLALQAAIDSGAAVIHLSGVFQLDGPSVVIDHGNLRITADAVDDDGDGQTNEDPNDAVDNDGDGATDEDDYEAEIRGVVDDLGLPAPEVGFSAFFNRGLLIGGVSGTAADITIENLKLSSHFRAVSASPRFAYPRGNMCDDVEVTGGEVRGLRLRDNLFVNNTRAFQIFGDVSGFEVTGNRFDGAVGVLLVGGAVACIVTENPITTLALPMGPVKTGTVARNTFESPVAQPAAVSLNVTHGILVRDNVVRVGSGTGIQVVGGGDALLLANTVLGGWSSISLINASPGSTVIGNTTSGARDYGITLLSASGIGVINNFLTGGRGGLRILGISAPTVTMSCGNRIVGGPAPLTWVNHNPRGTTCAVPNVFLGTLRELSDGAPGFEVSQDASIDP
jgi:hypothetical protein